VNPGFHRVLGPTGEPLPLPDGEAPFHSWAP
jgi:hypothetical protein